MRNIELLDWDSNWLEIQVARTEVSASEIEDMESIFSDLEGCGADLIYVLSSTPLLFANQNTFEVCLADEKLTYLKKIDKTPFRNPNIHEFDAQLPDESLLKLALESGVYSRFNRDRKIGRRKFEELYTRWITDSVSKKIALEVLVYSHETQLLGFVTLGEKNKRADIGIIAVDQNSRGKGVGRSLVQAGENWFSHQGYSELQVVTQADNLEACALYDRCGFHIESREYVYHFWRQ